MKTGIRISAALLAALLVLSAFVSCGQNERYSQDAVTALSTTSTENGETAASLGDECMHLTI